MRTSATCPRNARRGDGFTLFEILVVLVVLALVAGTTMVQLTRMYTSFEESSQRDELARQISRLGVAVVNSGRGLVLEGVLDSASELLNIPPQWQVIVPQPITYRYSGICHGGTVLLELHGRRYPYELAPPYCRARPLR